MTEPYASQSGTAAPEPSFETATRLEPVYESDNEAKSQTLADLDAGQATLVKFLREGKGAFVTDAEHKLGQDEPIIRDSV